MRQSAFLILAALLTCGCGDAGKASPPADLSTRKAGSDWTHFLGPNANSTSPEKGLIVPWPKGGPRVVWDLRLGEGYAAPTVSHGRLFVCDRIRNRARMRCLNSETGKELWVFEYRTDYRDKYGYDGGPRCCPVVDDDRVYLYGPEGMLHCVRVADGKPVWKVDTAKKFGVVQNFFGVGASPVVHGDLLLVQVGGSPPGSDASNFLGLKSNGSALVALDKLTGAVRYKTGDDLASYSTPVLARVNKKDWCFLFARNGLLGIDPANGKVRFHHPWRARILESVNASCPVVVGNRVLVSECYGPGSALLEITPDDKVKEVWTDAAKGRSQSLRCHWMTPIHVDGYLYGCSGRHTSEADLRCVELATGKVMWRERGTTRSSLLLVDGHFVCLSEDGTLRLLAVNPKKYEEVSRVVLRGADDEPLLKYPCWAAPVLAHGLLYLRGEGRLVCLEVIRAGDKE